MHRSSRGPQPNRRSNYHATQNQVSTVSVNAGRLVVRLLEMNHNAQDTVL